MQQRFFGATNPVESEEKLNEKLQVVLHDIEAMVDVEDQDFNSGDDDSTIYSKDRTMFVTKVNLAINGLGKKLASGDSYFRVFLATDFNQWELEKIKDLAIFFSLFQDSRVLLVIDAQQLAGLEEKKFEAFIVAAQKATGLAEIYMADFSDKLEGHLSEERKAFIMETLSDVDFTYHNQPSKKKESVLDSLISTQPKMNFLPQASTNKNSHFWKPVIIGAAVGAIGVLCALSLKRK